MKLQAVRAEIIVNVTDFSAKRETIFKNVRTTYEQKTDENKGETKAEVDGGASASFIKPCEQNPFKFCFWLAFLFFLCLGS